MKHTTVELDTEELSLLIAAIVFLKTNSDTLTQPVYNKYDKISSKLYSERNKIHALRRNEAILARQCPDCE